MASNIIDFPGAYVTPNERAQRRQLEEGRAAAWAEIGTPYEFAGTDFALFCAFDDDIAPRTREQMHACHLLMHIERLARHPGAEAVDEARAMRRTVTASMR